ncbi:MAG TPA: helix-turn-helix domain-containing protein [Solirubrobacterales bacterium]|nr:helix-turn-helix domain-containing protein [Solirubrobacterales bacterium]
MTEARLALRQRLERRRADIELALATRIFAISPPSETADPVYVESLRDTLPAALDYALGVVAFGHNRLPAVPPILRAQARLAVRNGVALETVLRRYLAGYSLVLEFVIQEAAGASQMRGWTLQQLLVGQAGGLDRLVAAVSEEFGREAALRTGSGEERTLDQVKRLLAGELIDPPELGYRFEGWHLGIAASNWEVGEELRRLAVQVDRKLLLVKSEGGVAWAWFGSRRPLEGSEVSRICGSLAESSGHLAVGEPAQGREGWRLTHQQAIAALAVAKRRPREVTRYADVSLVAAVLQNDLLARSLEEMYMKPLGDGRDGDVLRDTLRAYFEAERNVSSAAAALGVNRNTVAKRLRSIEERLGRTLSSSAAEIEAALALRQVE